VIDINKQWNFSCFGINYGRKRIYSAGLGSFKQVSYQARAQVTLVKLLV
jgi:hypothetical protein